MTIRMPRVEAHGYFCVFLTVVLLTASLYAQDPIALPMESAQFKVYLLTPINPSRDETFSVENASTLRIEYIATAGGVSPTIITPTQTITPDNITIFGGTFGSYEVGDEQAGIFPSLSFVRGFHGVLQIPNPENGIYTLRLQSPENFSQDIAVAAVITTDSQVSARLFTVVPDVKVGNRISLSAAVFDGENALANANVNVSILSPAGNTSNLTLYDNGEFADGLAGDGLYSGEFIPGEVGVYTARAKITGTTASGVPYSRETNTQFTAKQNISRLTGAVRDFGEQDPSDGRFLKNIVIEADTETTLAGRYGLKVHLKTSSNRYLIESGSQDLTVGPGFLQAKFDAKKILENGENGPFDIELIELFHYESNGLPIVIDKLRDIGQTQAYQLSQMTRPKISFTGANSVVPIDLNSNGKYEALTFNVGVNVIASGEYTFSGTIFDSNRDRIDGVSNQAYLTEGNNTISFTIISDKILEHGLPGPYQLGNVVIWGNGTSRVNYDTLTTLPYTLDQFEIGPAIAFAGGSSAAGIDANLNGKYDSLRIATNLYVAKEATYTLQAKLEGPTENVIQTLGKEIYLRPGINRVQFDFDGASIAIANIDGPLTIADVSVSGSDSTLSTSVLFTTQSFNSNQFEIGLEFTGQNNAEGIDSNQNGKFETLRIRTELYSFLPGYYTIQLALRGPDGNLIQTITKGQTLISGVNQLQFDFSGIFIRNASIDGPLSIGNVMVSGMGRTLQVPVLFTTQNFNSDQFEALFEFTGSYSATGVDTNGDGKFNLLRVQGNINIAIPGTYAVIVELKDSSGYRISQSGRYFNFVAGVNPFTLDIRGNDILRSGINGPYRISAQAWDHPSQTTILGVDNLFQTDSFSYTDFEQTFGFTGVNAATGIDTNANGKFETLRISSELRIERPGAYTVRASLKDSNGQVIQTRTYDYNLSQGANTLNFDFDGLIINNFGVDGAYTVGDVAVSGTESLNVPTLFTTQAFSIDQFESAPADLHFSSYRLAPTVDDGDGILEPGETAMLFVTLSNRDRGSARNSSSELTSASPNVEILNNGSFGSIGAASEKESSGFQIRLKADAPYGVSVPFALSVSFNGGQTETFTFSARTGKQNKIFYTQVVQNRQQIFSMNADGTGVANLSNNTFSETDPRISPDGTKVAFIRNIGSTTSELWVMHNDGSNKQRVTELYRYSWVDHAWSPDSSKIAFIADPNNVPDVFVINANGTDLTRLTNTPGTETHLAWSVTDKIAYTTDYGEDIHTINPDGSGDAVIHDNPYNELWAYDLAWSPDGSWLAWTNDRVITNPTRYYVEVYVSRPDGSEKRNVTENIETYSIAWSPDSTRIAYVDELVSSEPEKIAYVDLTTDQTTQLSNFANGGAYRFTVEYGSGGLGWSKNGRGIAFVGLEGYSYPGSSYTYSIFEIDPATGELSKLISGKNGSVYEPEWENIDRIPPSSLVAQTPSQNSFGWNASDVTIGISATDDQHGSGVQNISYNASGAHIVPATTVNASSVVFNLFKEGVSVVSYASKDNKNNTEDGKTYTVRIDKTRPISVHSSTVSGAQTSFTLSAADAVSGIREIVYTIDGGASQIYTAPFSVSNADGHEIRYFSRDLAGNEEVARTTHVNPSMVAKSVLVSEFRTRGALGPDDEFIELYNNSDSPIDISGWTVSTKYGSNATPIELVVINSGTILPGRGHYLLRKSGVGIYSLSAYAEADQIYTGALGDNVGIKLISSAGVTIDAVGFASVTDATYREGTGITPSAGITTNGQYSFARNFTNNLPVDLNNNKTDFAFVSTDGATFNNLKSVLGSPGPENLASPIYREGDVIVQQIDPNVTLAESPNRVFDYSDTSAAYPVGKLSVRYKLTNNTAQTISQLRLRITAITTKNSPVVFPQQAILRILNSSDLTVSSANGQTTIPLKGLTFPSNPSVSDGGFNSSLILNLGAGGLAPGASVNVDIRSGIVVTGQYRLEFSVEKTADVP